MRSNRSGSWGSTGARSLPLFPIVLIDDTPLRLASGHALGGEPEPLAAHIAYFWAQGTLRARPLQPVKPSSDVLERCQHASQAAYGAPTSVPGDRG